MTVMGIFRSMTRKGSLAGRVLSYCLLFLLSLLVFDYAAIVISVLFGLFALHFFSGRQENRNR